MEYCRLEVKIETETPAVRKRIGRRYSDRCAIVRCLEKAVRRSRWQKDDAVGVNDSRSNSSLTRAFDIEFDLVDCLGDRTRNARESTAPQRQTRTRVALVRCQVL